MPFGRFPPHAHGSWAPVVRAVCALVAARPLVRRSRRGGGRGVGGVRRISASVGTCDICGVGGVRLASTSVGSGAIVGGMRGMVVYV
jgi:hypothetical protein